jgi:hypothetical protein
MSDAHYNIGNIYLEKEQHGLALAHYKQALELRPNWERAVRGLEQCEAVLHRGRGMPAGPSTPPPSPAKSGSASVKETQVDPNRMIDPASQGLLLSALHKATAESETVSRSFIKIVESEVEPVIKELSTCLMYPESSAHSLDKCLQKFEAAVNNMRGAQQQLKTSMHEVQQLGDQLLRS